MKPCKWCGNKPNLHMYSGLLFAKRTYMQCSVCTNITPVVDVDWAAQQQMERLWDEANTRRPKVALKKRGSRR